ncbi:MAG TPA: hypothetical protein VGA95_08735 [Thermodesulfobacteriota bacterium]
MMIRLRILIPEGIKRGLPQGFALRNDVMADCGYGDWVTHGTVIIILQN